MSASSPSRASLPVVGISACVREINTLPFHTVNQRYLAALVEAAGVMPIIIPAIGCALPFETVAAQLDGLLVTGSPSNVEPHLYGCERAAPDILHDPARDATTLPLLQEALRQEVPVFAICRGIQELNVALGGTLHQFLHAVPGRSDHRSDKSKPIHERWRPAHPVQLTAGSYLARLAGAAEVMVNSLHAQGLDRLGEGLVVEAVAPDGTVEAVRVAGARCFTVGVQWHPEALYAEDRLSRRLFEEFGEAARQRAAARLQRSAAA